ncbi:Cubilin [Holothuria leucospilota]|uniref:Cubilin n=1 Tax=Holothuria leucospilota TaxID=206669 RepID=A0A9Q0YR07_HOLLE|nr:Cubilin [Holothuria leucospilota]
MCNFHVFCKNGLDEENCQVYLEDGNITEIIYPILTDGYPEKQHQEWRLLSTKGFLLNFSDFNVLKSDVLTIKHGRNSKEIDEEKTVTGTFTAPFAYVFDGPFLLLNFTRSYAQRSQFRVNISATNISSLVHCDGLVIPDFEMCNFHVFCKNAIDEENCQGLSDEGQPIKIPYNDFPNVYHSEGRHVINEWRLSSESGYQVNITASRTVHLIIENVHNTQQQKLKFVNRFEGTLQPGVRYAFEMSLLRIYIRLSWNDLGKEVGLYTSPNVEKHISYWNADYGLIIDIVAENVIPVIDCSKVCPDLPFTSSQGEIISPSNLEFETNYNCLCEWNITVSKNSAIKLNMTFINLPCDLVHLEIVTYLNDSLGKRKHFVCGDQVGIIISEGNTMILRLQINTGERNQVFRANYEEIDVPGCGIVPFNKVSRVRYHTCSAPSAFIASPNYPLTYETGMDFVWLINTSPSTYIEVVFAEFDIESSTNCCKSDYLEFEMYPSIFRLCNANINSSNPSFFSDKNKLTIRLHSVSVVGRFLAVYSERNFMSAVESIALKRNLTCMALSRTERQNCYCLFDFAQEVTWKNASKVCKTCGEGGFLATIRSQREMNFLQQLVLREGDATKNVYIGKHVIYKLVRQSILFS